MKLVVSVVSPGPIINGYMELVTSSGTRGEISIFLRLFTAMDECVWVFSSHVC